MRVLMNLLFSEHVYLVAKAGDAAAGGRTSEYTAYATQLTKNSDDIQSLINSAAGANGSSAFGNIWNQYLGFVAAYTVGVVTHDDAKTASAASGLNGQFTPAMANYLGPQTAPSLVQQFASDVRAILDDEAAAAWPKLFADIAAAAQVASQIGDDLGTQFIRAYPDRFPGTSTGNAFSLRRALNLDFQQLAYLGTMATAAIVGARADEANSASHEVTLAVQSLTKELATSKPETWNSWTTDLVSYASKVQVGDIKQAWDQVTNDSLALVNLFEDPEHMINQAVSTQTQAELAVVDAQRVKDVNETAARDRVAATAMEGIANAVTAFVVKANPADFKS